MPEFAFFVTDTFRGSVYGTNNEKLALELAESEDYFVVRVATSEQLLPDSGCRSIIDFDVKDDR